MWYNKYRKREELLKTRKVKSYDEQQRNQRDGKQRKR